MGDAAKEQWTSGDAYDVWIGRWSRHVARTFIDWLGVPRGCTWGDVGCGTGALVESILRSSDPASVLGVDRSAAYVREAGGRIGDPRVRLQVGDACALGWAAGSCDVTVSGLVLNFVPDPGVMAREMVRVTRPGGKVAAYVWDYAGGMQMIRHFWDVVRELNPEDAAADQGERFPICQPAALEELFRGAGLLAVSARAIDITTVFRDFQDYWTPFLGKQGAAPAYLASLPAERQDRIRGALMARLGAAAAGPITMTARAWAVQGTVPPNRGPGASG